MNKMIKLALSVVTTAALGTAATSTAYAGISMQGPLLSGIVLQSFESNQPLIAAVTLPSDETIDLRQQTIGEQPRATN
jgi:hypothetical protein